jgi:hypothetical protein
MSVAGRTGGHGDRLAHNLAIARNLAIASRHSITPTSNLCRSPGKRDQLVASRWTISAGLNENIGSSPRFVSTVGRV